MNTEMVVQPRHAPMTPEQVDLIKNTIAKDATNEELKLFLYQCSRTGLDPLAKQIYFQKRGGKIVIVTGIDGYRLTAERTGKYAGSDDPIYDNEDKPSKATATVYKLVGGVRCPFSASARWDQYYPGDSQGHMWRKMPHLMLGKCAEALALRKAFPQELSGVYVKEEMDQAGIAEDGSGGGNDSRTAANPGALPSGNKSHKPVGNPVGGDAATKVYRNTPEEYEKLKVFLEVNGVPEPYWPEVAEQLDGEAKKDWKAVVNDIMSTVQ